MNEKKRPCERTESEHVTQEGMLIFTCHKTLLSPNRITEVMFSPGEN